MYQVAIKSTSTTLTIQISTTETTFTTVTKRITDTLVPNIPRKKIDERQIDSLDNSSILANTLSKELLLALSLNLANLALELLRPKYNISMILACSLLIGFIKGVMKTASDLLCQKDISPYTIGENCFLEVLTELTAEVLLYFSGEKLNIAELNFAKSIFKNSLKWSFKNETFKSEYLEDCLKACLNLFIFREIIATFTSTILITAISNGLIEASKIIINADKFMTSPKFANT